jgi:hypothetical protein
MHDYRLWLSHSRRQLLSSLLSTVSGLCNVYEQRADAEMAVKSARVQAFMRSEATTVAGRERDVDAEVLHLSLAVLELGGQIQALTEERDLIHLLLDEDARQDRPMGDHQGLPPRDQGQGLP